MFLLLIQNRALNNFVHRFCNDNSLTGCQRNKRVWACFDVTDHLGIEYEAFAIESGELDHRYLSYERRIDRYSKAR